MISKITKLNYQELKELILNSISVRQMLITLNVNTNGSGAYKILKKHCDNLGLEIPFYKPRGNNNLTFKIIPLEYILIENSTYSCMHRLKKRLIAKGLLKFKCSKCEINEWCGQELSLHLDHINGINNDNRLENLRLLCPNCHSQTNTYAGKNKKKKIKINKTNIRLKSRKVQRPDYEQLKNEIEENGYVATGKKYGVSDNAVRKWIINYNKNK